jgi:hypothetical protein
MKEQLNKGRKNSQKKKQKEKEETQRPLSLSSLSLLHIINLRGIALDDL